MHDGPGDPRDGWRDAVAVGVGGALGALARVGVDGLVGGLWGLVAINLGGAVALALLNGRDLPGRRGPFWRTGVLGAFTTFSAMALLAIGSIEDASLMLALTAVGYLLARGILVRGAAA